MNWEMIKTTNKKKNWIIFDEDFNAGDNSHLFFWTAMILDKKNYQNRLRTQIYFWINEIEKKNFMFEEIGRWMHKKSKENYKT